MTTSILTRPRPFRQVRKSLCPVLPWSVRRSPVNSCPQGTNRAVCAVCGRWWFRAYSLLLERIASCSLRGPFGCRVWWRALGPQTCTDRDSPGGSREPQLSGFPRDSPRLFSFLWPVAPSFRLVRATRLFLLVYLCVTVTHCSPTSGRGFIAGWAQSWAGDDAIFPPPRPCVGASLKVRGTDRPLLPMWGIRMRSSLAVLAYPRSRRPPRLRSANRRCAGRS